jgi:hypothetical protein
MSSIGLWLDTKTAIELQAFIKDERVERVKVLRKLAAENNDDVIYIGEVVGMLCTVERILNDALELAIKGEIKMTAQGARA